MPLALNLPEEQVYLSEGEVPVAVGVELLEELPALLLGLVRPLEGELLVDGRPVHAAHLECRGGFLVPLWTAVRLLDARGRLWIAAGLRVSVLGRN